MSILDSVRGLHVPTPHPPRRGVFISFEGGDGAGKSTQMQLLRDHLVTDRSVAEDLILTTREPGGTPLGRSIRGLLLHGGRYLGSSVAYQGAGRELDGDEIAALSLWAVDGLLPHRTILLDVPPQTLDERRDPAQRDRLESAGLAFHEAVRQEFLDLAAADPERYAVIDGTLPREEVHAQVLEAIAEVLNLFDPTFEPAPPTRHRDEQ